MSRRGGSRAAWSWKDVTRGWVGRACVPWLPAAYVARFVEAYYVDQEPAGFFGRAVRDELTRRYYGLPEVARRADNRNHFWGSTAGVRWHERRHELYQDARRFRDEYLASRRPLIEAMTRLVERASRITTLCEIGTGSGLMVNHLAGHLTGIERFCAIDLSAEQIARNRERYAGSKVEFLHVEAADYLARHCRPGTLFLACGTFECFTQAELEDFLALSRRAADPVAVAICDAVDVDYDATVERDSRPRGNLLYNHNYRHLLEKHGYETVFSLLESPKPIYDRLSILATGSPWRYAFTGRG
jgi:hypothetical protein